MAFVPTPAALVGAKSFRGAAISPSSSTARVAAVRMAADPGPKDSPTFGKAGKSMWKENYFTGGFPGGEQFYKAWTEDGMTKDVPDVPASMQSGEPFTPKVESKPGILGKLDKIEFFKRFIQEETPQAQPADVPPASSEPVSVSPASSEPVSVSPASSEPATQDDGPDESLYAPYFPAKTRNLAPDIKLVYEKDFYKDRVYMAMTEVTASATDVYFPKEMKNKAPIIEISYNGALAMASISVCLGDIEGLPTLPAPAKRGDAVTTLVPGAGGGLKLNFSVEGGGPVKI